MGLLNVLTGMQNGPRGFAGGSRGGGLLGSGMSPIAGAVLGLLAYKAVKSFSNSPSAGTSPTNPTGSGAMSEGSGSQGGLGDMLRNGLNSILGGGGAGTAMSGGLGDLVRQFQQAGKGEVADSWVSKGANRAIPTRDLEQVLTPEQVSFLTQRTGLSREDLMAGLSEQLPKAVDQLTPEGRLPTDKEIATLI